MKKDDVDFILEQWKQELPELCTTSMAVWGRLQRVGKYVEKRLSENFTTYQLNSGEFDVLATLRRSGSEFKLKPTDLYQSLMVTSGAMTNRIDTLEKKGLVTRVHDNADRRTVYVQLTKEGYNLISKAVFTHAKTEDTLLMGLAEDEKIQFNHLLKKLLSSLEER